MENAWLRQALTLEDTAQELQTASLSSRLRLLEQQLMVVQLIVNLQQSVFIARQAAPAPHSFTPAQSQLELQKQRLHSTSQLKPPVN